MTDKAAVEAVARAIAGTMFAPHELPLTGNIAARYRETAKAAIEAIDASRAKDAAPVLRSYDGKPAAEMTLIEKAKSIAACCASSPEWAAYMIELAFNDVIEQSARAKDATGWADGYKAGLEAAAKVHDEELKGLRSMAQISNPKVHAVRCDLHEEMAAVMRAMIAAAPPLARDPEQTERK